ncbi:MAG: DUF4189 domain-containing protein [Kiritimatiellae bacterium]|nr:DUF4189 domain-containing protein [Kiritimatiellia bacterium]
MMGVHNGVLANLCLLRGQSRHMAEFGVEKQCLMKTRFLRMTMMGVLSAQAAFCGDLIENAVPSSFWNRQADVDGPLTGYVEWKDRYREDASDWDKTDYWAAIAVSQGTGKYAASCEWLSWDIAERAAREKCNAPDARPVVVCGNGWCALALGDQKPGKDFGWGVGWGPDQETAERFALDAANKQGLPKARVVYSIDSRQPKTGGAIAFSESTGQWGYSTGGGRHAPYMAIQHCKAPDAKIIAQASDCWLALALGDDKGAYGWGNAGNRIDAERNALQACSQRTKNAKIVLSFCSNGVVH